jgi:hypothetical protein
MPLTIIAQAKISVAARPERGGMRMAKRPARISRTLRAMDQPRDLGAIGDSGVGAVLIRDSPKDVDTAEALWAENIIGEKVQRKKIDMSGVRPAVGSGRRTPCDCLAWL